MSDPGAPRTRRRWGRWAALAGLVVLLGALAWLGIGTLTAAREVRAQAVTAQDSLGAAAQALDDGDVAAARAAVATGAEAVDAADAALASTPVSVVGSLPVVGQAVADARALTSAAGHATSAAGAVTEAYAAASGDDGGPRLFAAGAVDESVLDSMLGSITTAAEEVDQAQADLDTVEAALPGTASLAEARDAARAELDGLQVGLGALAAAAPALPSALGFDGPRTYLLGILNSAELRASGGPPTAGALLGMEQGRLEVLARGQTDPNLIDGSPQVRWEGADGTPRYDRFVNATADPDFRNAGVDLARSFEAATGTAVDGVITVDPVALAAVLDATGPLQSRGYGEITGETFIAKVLVDAYERFAGAQGARQRLNAEMIDQLTRRLTTGEDALAVLRALGTTAPSRNVQMWFADPELERAVILGGLAGAMGDPAPEADRIAVFSQNANASKVDVFQERTIESEVQLASDGSASVTQTVTIRNQVPDSRSADKRRGYRTGWSRSAYRIFVAERAEAVTTDLEGGLHAEVAAGPTPDSRGRSYVTVESWIPPSEELTIQVSYRLPEGTFGGDRGLTYLVLADPQALVRPADLSVTVRAPQGWRFTSGGAFASNEGTATWTGPLDRPLRLTAEAAP